MEDKRFTPILGDPKFRPIPKRKSKIKIDRRFQSMFTDKKFQTKYTVDKRGRPIKHRSTEDLKRYYDLSSGNSSDNDDCEDTEPGKFVQAPESGCEDTGPGKFVQVSESGGEDEEGELNISQPIDKKLSDAVKKKLHDLNIDYARGESKLFSDTSSSDEETDEQVSETEEIDHKWGELDGEAERTEELTHRLAACNMDWDRIRATDLMVLFNSFLPSGGVINSVAIYPSEFGKQRMREEEVKGPIELVKSKHEANENDNEEGSNYHMEKLRKYQLNRLKYYYAVIVFDSAVSANKIYTECDGMEYESTATKIDLRFIPDEMTFNDEPKEVCDKLPELKKYEPRFFTTTALQQARVELTWDETDPGRLDIAQKLNSGKADMVTEEDLQYYLAGSSDEEESETEEKINNDVEEAEGGESVSVVDKYKALLKDIEDKEDAKKHKDIEMEISWGIDLKEKTDKLMKKKMNESNIKTPFQQYLDKRKEKRKEKRAQKKTRHSEINEENDIPSDIDMNDKYFAEEFNKPEFRKTETKCKFEKINNIENGQNEAELELLLMNDYDRKKHFNFKKIQEQGSDKKAKKKNNTLEKTNNEDDFSINVNDERFSALFTSHHFNIDPSDPHYKKTKAMESLVKEKIKRRNIEGHDKEVKKSKMENKKNPELSLLIKSVKRKTEKFNANKYI